MSLLNVRKNGFVLEEDPLSPPGCHFRLTAVPFSKNITFGVEGTSSLDSLFQGDGNYRMFSQACVEHPSDNPFLLLSQSYTSWTLIQDMELFHKKI